MKQLLRRLVPRPIRRNVSVRLAQRRSRHLHRHLAALAAGQQTIIAGPWLGEVGFELLYWVPFLRWFSSAFGVAPSRLLVVSRGGTASWYGAFASHYAEVFDYLGPEAFRRAHDDRVRQYGEQKQRVVTTADRGLIERIAADRGLSSWAPLHPSAMFEIMDPFWWQHVDETWVLRHAAYARLTAPCGDVTAAPLPTSYVAVKFYFNECFPETAGNRAFVTRVVRDLAEHTPVVSLTTGLSLDEHAAFDPAGFDRAGADSGVQALSHAITTLPAHLDPRRNLEVQSAIVAGASRFVGTYGGFAYLAPFYGVSSTAYYSDAAGFSPRHLAMAREALRVIGVGNSLDVRISGSHPHEHS